MANLTEQISAGFAELKSLFTARPVASADQTALIAGFESRLAGLQASAEKLTTDLAARDVTIAAHVATIAGHATQISNLTAEVATAKAAVTDFDAKVDAAAGVKSAAIVAGLGIPPLKVAAVEDPVAGKTEPKLTGLAAYQAAVKTQIASQLPAPRKQS